MTTAQVLVEGLHLGESLVGAATFHCNDVAVLADGICLDAEGHGWVAKPTANECVLVAEGGEVLDLVTTSTRCFACMPGGVDGRTLFLMTSHESDAIRAAAERTAKVETARVSVPHAGTP